jgi:hypothetical protein
VAQGGDVYSGAVVNLHFPATRSRVGGARRRHLQRGKELGGVGRRRKELVGSGQRWAAREGARGGGRWPMVLGEVKELGGGERERERK